MTIVHYKRFMTHWAGDATLKREGVTIVLSPHIDDAFLSLYEHMASGTLGKNIVCINFFTTTDSSIITNASSTFKNVASTSVTREKEELAFSEHLLKHGINYVPSFIGFKDAALNSYYGFITSRLTSRIPLPQRIFSKQINTRYATLGIHALVKNIISEYKGVARRILIPAGLGKHTDHLIINKAKHALNGNFEMGLYCEIPYAYYSGYNTLEKLKKYATPKFKRMSSKKFDAAKKLNLFKRIYTSQFNAPTAVAIKQMARSTGEVIFWQGN